MSWSTSRRGGRWAREAAHARGERDRALRDHVECVHFFDEQTGDFYEPAEPPRVLDLEGDADAEVAPDVTRQHG
jgi:hypothetical protein